MRIWIKKIWLGCLCTAALTLGGCANAAASGAAATETDSGAQMMEAESEEVAEVTTLEVTDFFTERDQESAYDEADCVKITLSGTTASCDGDGVTITDGEVRITAEGTYLLTGKLTGSIVVDADDADKVRLILNQVSVTCEGSAALYVRQADKVFVTTAADSENVLTSVGEFETIDENQIDGAIFSKDDLTLNGDGSLTVVCEAGHGIVCKDDLKITSGAYVITAASHGIQAKDSVRILDGSLAITAGEDGIHSGNDEDDTVGYTYIGGGDVTLTVGDDGIHADTQLVVTGGTLTVEESYEGLEGTSIEITGGTLTITADDDGLNAAGGNDGSGQAGGFGEDPFGVEADCTLIVSGGSLTVYAEGDGLDSNGSLYINGGEIVIYGPVNDGNGAIDYGTEAVVNGGTLLAFGSSGMAETFSETSTQGAILLNLSSEQEAGTTVELLDDAGTLLLSGTAAKRYDSVLLSCAALESGESYTVKAGTVTEDVEMTGLIYESAAGMRGEPGSAPGGAPFNVQ